MYYQSQATEPKIRVKKPTCSREFLRTLTNPTATISTDLLESPLLNTHGGNVYLAFVVFQKKLNLDIEFSNKLQQLTFSGPNYLIQNTSEQGVLNKRETMEKFAISRSTTSLITAEREKSLSLREANSFLFHSPAEKENARKALSASRGQPPGTRQTTGMESVTTPVTWLPGRALEEASRHPRVLLRNHYRAWEEH